MALSDVSARIDRTVPRPRDYAIANSRGKMTSGMAMRLPQAIWHSRCRNLSFPEEP
jgi:hypothetical protein